MADISETITDDDRAEYGRLLDKAKVPYTGPWDPHFKNMVEAQITGDVLAHYARKTEDIEPYRGQHVPDTFYIDGRKFIPFDLATALRIHPSTVDVVASGIYPEWTHTHDAIMANVRANFEEMGLGGTEPSVIGREVSIKAVLHVLGIDKHLRRSNVAFGGFFGPSVDRWYEKVGQPPVEPAIVTPVSAPGYR
tara:strand:- start:7074 stop:7652 length:579 start_codon:yes stop_codon:yes gene_type:complete